MNRFKTGFALTSVSSGVPIHTIFIERSGSYLGKEAGLWEPAEVPIRMSVRVGEVFEPRENETAKSSQRDWSGIFGIGWISRSSRNAEGMSGVRSATQCVIIPSYNSGPLLAEVVREVADRWAPVWVVVDASTDGSERDVLAMDGADVRCIVLAENVGKGGAVLAGMRAARAAGMSQALVMDGDGQHDVSAVEEFMAAAEAAGKGSMILGEPIFGPEAPGERVKGRKIGNFFANVETAWGGIGDSLFGFRVYPVEATVEVMESIRTARRFDFDTEVVVRLFWRGVRPINRKVRVFYPARAEGGVTHFRYLRDNAVLVYAHARLLIGSVWWGLFGG